MIGVELVGKRENLGRGNSGQIKDAVLPAGVLPRQSSFVNMLVAIAFWPESGTDGACGGNRSHPGSDRQYRRDCVAQFIRRGGVGSGWDRDIVEGDLCDQTLCGARVKAALIDWVVNPVVLK